MPARAVAGVKKGASAGDRTAKSFGEERRATDERVLRVDPDPDERSVTAETLRAAGFAVTTAGSVAEAREALDERPDCLVVETSMPDGWLPF